MNDDERAEFVKETMEKFRAVGRDALKARYPELAAVPGAASALPSGFEPQAGRKPVKLKPKSLREIVPPEMMASPPPTPAGFARAP